MDKSSMPSFGWRYLASFSADCDPCKNAPTIHRSTADEDWRVAANIHFFLLKMRDIYRDLDRVSWLKTFRRSVKCYGDWDFATTIAMWLCKDRSRRVSIYLDLGLWQFVAYASDTQGPMLLIV